jgi:hypothetical protein
LRTIAAFDPISGSALRCNDRSAHTTAAALHGRHFEHQLVLSPDEDPDGPVLPLLTARLGEHGGAAFTRVSLASGLACAARKVIAARQAAS